jgi:DMSO/TMAO reductase YedYZ molybdopterin-dependent catalytic subunit
VIDQLDGRPTDRERQPPGQVLTRKWPVLHYSSVPAVETSRWRFTVSGAVDNPYQIGWDELLALPQRTVTCDIHCVTQWSRLDNVFAGIPLEPLLQRAKIRPEAHYVMVHADPDYTTNLPLEDLARPENLLALSHGGEALTPEHGGPVRLLVPHLYLWKSAKWVTGFEFMEEDSPGFWEQNGYHMRGDPWQEERFGRPDPVRMRRGPRR